MLCLNIYISTLVIMGRLMHVTTEVTRCFSEFCFTVSDFNQTKNFNDARSWCNNNSSTLAAVTDDRIQSSLTSVLSSSSADQLGLMFINLKLQQNRVETWYLLNGSNYAGSIYDQTPRDAEYRYYMYLKASGNIIFNAYASNPLITKNYVCAYDVNMCSNASSNSGFINNGICYVKYDNESLSWYKARERCKDSDGDLMMFYGRGQDYSVSSNFNTSWLNPSSSYWVGIRWNKWAWVSPDNGSEIVYTNWSYGKPNTSNFECVCVDPNGNPKWSWTDCDCNIQRQLLCLKNVPTTISSTLVPTSPLTTLNSGNSSENRGSDNAMALGVGIGLGGFIVIVIVVAVVVIVVMKRKKNKWTRSHNNEVNNVEKTETSNKTTSKKVIDDSPDYATVLSTSSSKVDKESSENAGEIVYAQPQFSGTVKSDSSYSDLKDSVASRNRNGDIFPNNRTRSLLPVSSGDIYANVHDDA